MRRTWGWVGALSLVVFSACAGKAPPAQQPAPQGPSIVVTPEMGHPHVGDAAPELEVTTPEGEKLQLSSLRGQVVVLAFVTSWCPFSQAEQPNLAKLAHDYAGSKDLRVVIVDIDQNEEGYRQYLARQDMGAPVYWTASAEAAQAWVPPNAAPAITRGRWRALVTANVVLDRKGTIRFFTIVDTLHFDAEMSFVRASLDELLKEPA